MRQHDGAKIARAAALAALRSAHTSELAAERASIAGEFAARRASLLAAVSHEFAAKMAAVMVATPRKEQAAAIASLRGEHAAKNAAVIQHVANEQKSAEDMRVSRMRQRHAQERKAIGLAFAVPTRASGATMMKYQHKELP